MKWRTLRNNTTDEQNIDLNCCHSSRPPTQLQASRLTVVKSVLPRMLRHHSDPQQLSHHDPHALPPNAHSRKAQPTHEHCVESQHNVSTADTLSHRFNVPRSVQRMKRRTIQDILLYLQESKLWSTACLEHSVTCSTAPARRSKALRHRSIATLTLSELQKPGTLSNVPRRPLAFALCLQTKSSRPHAADNVLAPHIIIVRLAPHIPCRSKHHVVCSLHAVTLNDTCPADAMLLVTMVS